jgi:hypothetical protein
MEYIQYAMAETGTLRGVSVNNAADSIEANATLLGDASTGCFGTEGCFDLNWLWTTVSESSHNVKLQREPSLHTPNIR